MQDLSQADEKDADAVWRDANADFDSIDMVEASDASNVDGDLMGMDRIHADTVPFKCSLHLMCSK